MGVHVRRNMQLSQLVARAAKGEAFIIAKAGKPVARVTAYNSPEAGQQKRIGFMAGEFTMPDDFDRILVAQAETEGFLLFTSDELVARYPGPVRLVQGN